jgi:MFS transporter, CP family, cyanate transporter
MGNPDLDRKRYRWVILTLLWLLYVAFGMVQRAIAPLVTPILADLDLSYTQMGFILGSWQLTYIAAAIVTGALIDRWGIRKSLLAGAIFLGLSSALRYFAHGFSTMLGAVAVAGIGGPMISVGCPKAISLWFEGKSRGTAIGIYLTGAWIGGILALTMTNSFIMPLAGNSWRNVFLLYGLLTVAAGLIWWLLAQDGPDRLSTAETPGMISLLVRFINVRDILIVLVLGPLVFAILHALTNWLPKILETAGFSPPLAGMATAIPLASGLPSLLIVPGLIAPHQRGRFLAASSLLILVSLVMIMTASGGLLLAGLILFGTLIAPFFPILTLILMDTPEVGSTYMGSVGGMFFCVSEIGGFAGPLIMGAIVDLTGSFQMGTFFFVVLCLAVFALSLQLKTKPPRKTIAPLAS